MGLPQKSTSLEGFDGLWEAEPQENNQTSVDVISKQIQGILKTLVDEKIALKQENNLVAELKEHIHSLELQIQTISWQLGQREKELSDLYSNFFKVKTEKEKYEKDKNTIEGLLQENKEIRKLAEQLSNQILQEKAKNEMLVDLLKQIKQPELTSLEKQLNLK